MRSISLVLVLLLVAAPGFLPAQGISFDQGSWSDVVKKAKKEKERNSPMAASLEESLKKMKNGTL